MGTAQELATVLQLISGNMLVGGRVAKYSWSNKSRLSWGTFNIVETTFFRRLTQAQANGVFCDATPSATEVTITVDQDRNLNISTSDADNRICASDAKPYRTEFCSR